MIYFAQIGEGGPIKIGYSADPQRRMVQLRRHYGQPMIILSVIDGDMRAESEIHRRFRDCRIGGEQFRPTSDLLEYIGIHIDFQDPDEVSYIPPANPLKRNNQGVPVRIAADLHRKANYLAAEADVEISELISRLLRPVIEKEFAKAADRVDRQP